MKTSQVPGITKFSSIEAALKGISKQLEAQHAQVFRTELAKRGVR